MCHGLVAKNDSAQRGTTNIWPGVAGAAIASDFPNHVRVDLKDIGLAEQKSLQINRQAIRLVVDNIAAYATARTDCV